MSLCVINNLQNFREQHWSFYILSHSKSTLCHFCKRAMELLHKSAHVEKSCSFIHYIMRLLMGTGQIICMLLKLVTLSNQIFGDGY